MITKESAAARMHGREYGDEIEKGEERDLKAAGLVAIFGYSDDNIELRGAISDEVGAYSGTKLYLHRGGVLPDPESEECERCARRLQALRKKCVRIACLWSEIVGYSWFIRADDIKSRPFDIMEDGEKFCRGIVIDANDLPIVDID